MRTAIKGKWIEITFPYNRELVEIVRTLPDREYRPAPYRHWRVPATPWHAKKVIEIVGNGNDEIKELAAQTQTLAKAAAKVRARGDLRLRSYQRAAVTFIEVAGGRALVADDVGLGKTAEAIIAAVQLGDENILVICPSSVTYQWQEEFLLWAETPAQVIEKRTTPIDTSLNVWIASYDIMTSRIDEFVRIDKTLLILDEVQKMKTPKAARTKACRRLAKGTPHIIGLTGTPIENHPLEVFNFLHIVDPLTWKDRGNFAWRYNGGGFTRATGRPTNLPELKDRLKMSVIRRLKSEVLDQLPALTRTVIPVDITNKASYVKLKREMIQVARDGENVLPLITKLRYTVGVGKVQAVVRLAKDFLEATGERTKLVVFAHHEDVVDQIADALEPYGVRKIVGSTSQLQRKKVRLAFQEELKPRVLVISTAGAEGINLYGKNGNDNSNMIMAELEWTSTKMEQIEGRLHRSGQKENVNIIYPIAKGTMDQDMYDLLEEKRDLVRKTVRVNEYETIEEELLDRMEA